MDAVVQGVSHSSKRDTGNRFVELRLACTVNYCNFRVIAWEAHLNLGLKSALAAVSLCMCPMAGYSDEPPQVAAPPVSMIEKPDIYRMVDGCRPSLTRQEVADEPHRALTLKCDDPCIEEKLNAWVAASAENRQNYFAYSSVYKIEREAGLLSCRSNSGSYATPAACYGPSAPDIQAKIGLSACGKTIECEARFDIDADGKPADLVASCPDGPARAELERETRCLTRSMNFESHRGRKNVVQPIQLQISAGGTCPTS